MEGQESTASGAAPTAPTPHWHLGHTAGRVDPALRKVIDDQGTGCSVAIGSGIFRTLERGGFIGSEIAAALAMTGREVVLVPSPIAATALPVATS